MILGENVGSVYTKGKEIQKVYSKGKLVWEKEPIDYSVMPFTIKAVETMYVNVGKNRDPNTDIRPKTDFKYSINGGEWVNTNAEFISINLNRGDKISIISDVDYCYSSGVCDVYGNIMSLLYGENFIGQTVWKSRIYYSGNSGFFNGSGIRHAKNLILPATTLTEKCYRHMFSSCYALTTAPELPATTLTPYCYERMFYNCASLTTAPELPATTLATSCYEYMFHGCSSLTTAPELPATTLAVDCYNTMFGDCSSLTTAPELPATTLAEGCYQSMFRICSSLTTAPELPATTLVGLCYASMFYRCKSLKYIKCFATENISNEAGGSVINWTYGINTNGKLVCKQVDGGKNPLEDYIPDSWTVEYF